MAGAPDVVAQDVADPRAHRAPTPWAIPTPGWKEIALRSWREASDDNIGIVSAGVAFYGFLALVPLMAAIVLSYGLIAAPTTVIGNMQDLTSVMPADAAKLIGEQLMNVVKTSDGKKGLGVAFALAVALFGARNGAGSIIIALNIAYEEKERRGFLDVNLLAFAITAAGVAVAIVALFAIAALGHLEDVFPHLPGFILGIGKCLSYILLVLAGAAGAAALYRFGPSRQKPRWVWLTPGSVLTAILWLVLTIGFGLYVAHFGHYNATYGSLGAVVVLLTWLYLSSYILLFGAELNSECEHQAGQDVTVGTPAPLGDRDAWAADHVAITAASTEKDVPAETVGQASLLADFVVGRVSSRLQASLGLPKIGMLSSAMATSGLAMIRSPKRASFGMALLGAAGVLAWLGQPSQSAEDHSPAGAG